MTFEYKTPAEIEKMTEYQREKYFDQKKTHEEAVAKENAEKAAKEAVEAVKEDLNSEIGGLKEEIRVIKDEAERAKEEYEAKLADFNRLKIASTEAKNNGRTFDVALAEAIEENKEEFKNLDHKGGKARFQLKAVGDMGLSSIQNIDLANAQMRPGIAMLPNRRIHMRDILPTGRMTTSDYHYLREVGGEGDVGGWIENSGTKPQLDLDYIEKMAPSQFIAGWLRISRKSLDDVAALKTALAPRLLQRYLNAEDYQILNGDGTPPNLEGLLTVASSYDEGRGKERLIERLIDAIGQLEEGVGGLTDGFYADGVILKPRDWAEIAQTVNNNGTFTIPGLGIVSMNNGVLSVNGVNVYKINAMPTDPNRQFLAGDFQMGAQLLIREDPWVEFSYEDGDNFRNNQVTVRVEGRVALPIYYSEAFIKGTAYTPLT